METYLEQLLLERKQNRKASRERLECYLCQTPPTFEWCKKHFEEQGLKIHRDDYEAACKNIHKEPIFEKR